MADDEMKTAERAGMILAKKLAAWCTNMAPETLWEHALEEAKEEDGRDDGTA